MVMTLVGKQEVDYTSRKTGKPVRGRSLHVTYKSDDTEGVRTDNIYVSKSAPCYLSTNFLKVGDEVKICYNKYGGVDDIMNLSAQTKK